MMQLSPSRYGIFTYHTSIHTSMYILCVLCIMMMTAAVIESRLSYTNNKKTMIGVEIGRNGGNGEKGKNRIHCQIGEHLYYSVIWFSPFSIPSIIFCRNAFWAVLNTAYALSAYMCIGLEFQINDLAYVSPFSIFISKGYACVNRL